jgi:hypothetical protein
MARKKVVQGIDNFKRMIDVDAYYVDKTLFIKELIDKSNQIVLITRPRRFGKTLNMSMLKYFFEIKECRRFEMEETDTSYLFNYSSRVNILITLQIYQPFFLGSSSGISA